jgi:hypothetical protein
VRKKKPEPWGRAGHAACLLPERRSRHSPVAPLALLTGCPSCGAKPVVPLSRGHTAVSWPAGRRPLALAVGRPRRCLVPARSMKARWGGGIWEVCRQRERERTERGWMDVRVELTGLYKNFGSGRYGSVPVGSISLTLIDNHCRII